MKHNTRYMHNCIRLLALCAVSFLYASCDLEKQPETVTRDVPVEVKVDVFVDVIDKQTITKSDVDIKETKELETPLNKRVGNHVIYFDGWAVKDTVTYTQKEGKAYIKNMSPRSFDTTVRMIADDTLFSLPFTIERFMSYELSLKDKAVDAVNVQFTKDDAKELQSLQKIGWNIGRIENERPDSKRASYAAYTGKIDATAAQQYATFIYNYARMFASPEFQKVFENNTNIQAALNKNTKPVPAQKAYQDFINMPSFNLRARTNRRSAVAVLPYSLAVESSYLNDESSKWDLFGNFSWYIAARLGYKSAVGDDFEIRLPNIVKKFFATDKTLTLYEYKAR